MTKSLSTTQSTLLLGKMCLALALISFFSLFILELNEKSSLILVTSLFTALGFSLINSLRKMAYTFWIISAVVAALTFPQYFTQVGDFNLKNKY